MKSVPHILKALYDEDVVEEEALIAWHDKKSKGSTFKVKDAGKVFIDWLKYVFHVMLIPTCANLVLRNAEEEESDEEDDDEEEDSD